MLFISKPVKIVAALASVLALCACGEPSEGDIKEIVNKEIKPVLEMQWKTMNNFSAVLGGGQKASPPTLDDIKKVGCKADGENAYRCDVELVVLTGDKKDSKVVPMRLIKTSSGWKASN